MFKFPGFAILLCGFLVLDSQAQTPDKSNIPFAPIPEIDSMMEEFLAGQKVPGASLAIAQQGRLVYARGYGLAEKGSPVQSNHLFRIASISKPITAIAILQLVEKGKLKLGDRVTDVLGFEPLLEGEAQADPRWKEITIKQLLQHRAGFNRDKSFDPMFRSLDIARVAKKPAPADTSDIIHYMMGRKLDFDPGAEYSYSNFGYCLLGRVIEKKSGVDYESFVRANVLAPLGISQMRIGKSLENLRLPNEVAYHPPGDKKFNSVFPPYEPVKQAYGNWNQESLDAHGGWIASASDLVRLASSLDENAKTRALGKDLVKTMFSRPDAKTDPVFYALGWQVRQVAPAKMNAWHTGLLPGTSTILVRRHDGFTWAVLFNGSSEMGKGKSPQPASVIDGKIHQVVDRVFKP